MSADSYLTFDQCLRSRSNLDDGLLSVCLLSGESACVLARFLSQTELRDV